MNTIWNDCSTCERGNQPDKLCDQHYNALALHHQGPLWAPSKVLFAITIIINITAGIIYQILFHYRRFRNTNLLHRTGVSIFYYTIRVMFTMIPRYNQNQKVF